MLYENGHFGLLSESFEREGASIRWKFDEGRDQVVVFGKDKGIGQHFALPVARYSIEDGACVWTKNDWRNSALLASQRNEIELDCQRVLEIIKNRGGV